MTGMDTMDNVMSSHERNTRYKFMYSMYERNRHRSSLQIQKTPYLLHMDQLIQLLHDLGGPFLVAGYHGHDSGHPLPLAGADCQTLHVVAAAGKHACSKGSSDTIPPAISVTHSFTQ